MHRAFIVRPFGVKHGVDFDAVEAQLIGPALDVLGISGRTTGEIVVAGNIREDMFRLLLTADVVIADITVANTNVYYELGIRHALRDRHTVLIRSRIADAAPGVNEVPFDLKTDRYFSYDREDPGEAVGELVDVIRRTLGGVAEDSPVFKLLPGLSVGDWVNFLQVPDGFIDDVKRAASEGHVGDLLLFAQEAAQLAWGLQAVRMVGDALHDLGAWRAAELLWEGARRRHPGDPHVYRRLATIYLKRGDLIRSDLAVGRFLGLPGLAPSERAEAWSLRGSNDKTRWMSDWRTAPEDQRTQAALSSPHLDNARRHYRTGFLADNNHYYSALNALSLTRLTLELAAHHPDTWSQLFDSDQEAELGLTWLEKDAVNLVEALRVCLEAAKVTFEHQASASGNDASISAEEFRWFRVTEADFRFLTSDRPGRVAHGYRRALAGAPAFFHASVARQLSVFAELGVFPDRARAALSELQSAEGANPTAMEKKTSLGSPKGAEHPEDNPGPVRVLLFAGHRVDAPGRPVPRFPATPAAEGRARALIHGALTAELGHAAAGKLVGIAGAANGGDILFHEVCREVGIETSIFLAAERDSYVRASVADGGPDWVARFDALAQVTPSRVIQTGPTPLELPTWLSEADSHYDVWRRSNRWMLSAALEHGAERVTLIALSVETAEHGTSVTAHMMRIAGEAGVRTVQLDAAALTAP